LSNRSFLATLASPPRKRFISLRQTFLLAVRREEKRREEKRREEKRREEKRREEKRREEKRTVKTKCSLYIS
jgi:flagellar biosynthesis component FlhA